jgi:hypothetical protein
MSQVSLHKNNKINTPIFVVVPAGSQEVTVAFNFISEHIVRYHTECKNLTNDNIYSSTQSTKR